LCPMESTPLPAAFFFVLSPPLGLSPGPHSGTSDPQTPWKRTIWRLCRGVAVDCSTLMDLQQQTHGLQLMCNELVVPRDRRLTLNGADDVRHCRQSLAGPKSISVLFRSPANTTSTGYVVVLAASVMPDFQRYVSIHP